MSWQQDSSRWSLSFCLLLSMDVGSRGPEEGLQHPLNMTNTISSAALSPCNPCLTRGPPWVLYSASFPTGLLAPPALQLQHNWLSPTLHPNYETSFPITSVILDSNGYFKTLTHSNCSLFYKIHCFIYCRPVAKQSFRAFFFLDAFKLIYMPNGAKCKTFKIVSKYHLSASCHNICLYVFVCLQLPVCRTKL